MEANYPTIKPSLNLDFANTRRLDPRITFTRASSGTYFDEFGLLVTAAANVPRFDHDPVTGESLGLLREEQRTNLCISSNDLRTATEGNPNNEWFISGSTTITSNAAIGPDGLMSLDAVEENSTLSGRHGRQMTFSGSINTQYCASVFVRKGDRRYVCIYFGNTGFGSNAYGAILDLDTGTVVNYNGLADSVGVEDFGNGLYRLWVTATSDADGGSYILNIILAPNATTIGDIAGVIGNKTYWGFVQVEQGFHPSSFIATNGTEVTRAADSAVITGSNFSAWYNPVEGTLFAEAATADVSSGRVSVAVSDGTNLNQIQLGAYSSRKGFINVSGSAQMTQGIASVTFQDNVFSKVALAYATNNGNAAANGTLGTLDTSVTIPTVSQMAIGGFNIGFPLNGCIKRIAYYPRRLSDAQLQALTS